MDSVFNWKAILGKPVADEFHQPFATVLCSRRNREPLKLQCVPSSYTYRHKGRLHLFRPDIHAEV